MHYYIAPPEQEGERSISGVQSTYIIIIVQ